MSNLSQVHVKNSSMRFSEFFEEIRRVLALL